MCAIVVKAGEGELKSWRGVEVTNRLCAQVSRHLQASNLPLSFQMGMF